MEQQDNEVKEIKVEEIRRQKVYVPRSMTTNQVMEKYGLKPGAAYTARKKGFYVKNYSRPRSVSIPASLTLTSATISPVRFSNQTFQETRSPCQSVKI